MTALGVHRLRAIKASPAIHADAPVAHLHRLSELIAGTARLRRHRRRVLRHQREVRLKTRSVRESPCSPPYRPDSKSPDTRPLSIKSAVVGYGRAEKHQVQQMVTRFGISIKSRAADAADALAIASYLHTAATRERQSATADHRLAFHSNSDSSRIRPHQYQY